MIVMFILVLSILLQLVAAIMAFRLIPITGKRLAWSLISAALLLMVLRRGIPLIRMLSGDAMIRPDLNAELMGFVISLLMVVGISRIAPIFIDRKHAEDVLKESEEKYRALIETTNTGFVIVDQNGFVLDANKEYTRLTAHQDLGEIVGRSVVEWTADYDKEKNEKAVRECFNEGQIRNLEIGYIDSKGSITPVELNATCIAAEGGTQILMLCRNITNRKRAEEALLSLNQKLNDIIDFLPDATFVIDRDGKVIAWNRAIEEMTGIKAKEMLGKGNYEYAMPFYGKKRPILIDLVLNPQDEIEAEYASLKREEAVLAAETYTPALGKGNMYLYATASVIKDTQGNIIGAIESLRNITDRKEMESALRESEARYKTLFGSTSDGILILDAEAENLGKIVSANEAAAAMNGYSLDELLQLRIQDLDTPDSEEKVLERMKCLLSGDKLSFEVEHRRKDGSFYPVEVTANTINISGHHYAFAIHRDITERKRNEEALAVQHKYLIAILDGIPVPTFMIDRDHSVVLWNRSNETFTGITKEMVLGKRLDLSPLFKEKAPPTLAEIILNMTDEEIIRKFDPSSVRKNETQPSAFECTGKIWLWGEERTISIQAARILDSIGNTVGAVQTVQDITERIRLENQFRQAQKMEAIGTLAGGIAHDFNNILGAISGYTELALDLSKGENKMERYLCEIFNAAQRAKELVKQILTFSRQKEQEKKPIAVTRVIDEALGLLRASLPSTIEIRKDITVDSDIVLADPTQIHQVLMNLCSNAAHAMRDQGGILGLYLNQVNISADPLSRSSGLTPGAYLRLTVKDTGHGIPPDIIDRIFDPFFTTKKASEGTGMGLSVVHGIVKSHGGSITVESEQGKGTTFHVYIPVFQGIPVLTQKEHEGPIVGGNERILLVDDEEVLTNAYKEMLGRLGYDVTAKTSSTDALASFRAHPEQFDLVITDQTMPSMTGIQLSREIMNVRPDIPIILCTGFSESITRDQVLKYGIRAYVMKPIVRQQLAEVIRRELDKQP
jgi:PAS domain S-box-containing protein